MMPIGAFNRELLKTGEILVLTKTIEKLFSKRQIGDYDFQRCLDALTAKEDLEEAKKKVEEMIENGQDD
ncbi:MAG: hypothetical protein HYV59_15995 [Planctomycetes bacterium]|nr:hypothetical protein [Planctomycetota bacterium]